VQQVEIAGEPIPREPADRRQAAILRMLSGGAARQVLFELREVLGEDDGVAIRHDVPAEADEITVRTARARGCYARKITERRPPARHQAAARSANFAYRRRNESLIVSVGPLRCLAT
jgi:hypothetical protein